MTFYTSDCHFGHANIIRFCDRPFSSVEEMDETMVQLWNGRVQERDTVYILGDLFFRCEDPESILKRLRGKKHLILGNHDGSWTDQVPLNRYFLSVDRYLEIFSDGFPMTLCHYPMMTWAKAGRAYMIHGHIHNDTSQEFWPLLREREQELNASVELNGYQPVTLRELVENNRIFKAAH